MGQEDEIVIAGFGGSLRSGSYSRIVLREAERNMPEGSRMIIADISNIPLFNSDNMGIKDVNVENFRRIIKNSDGFLVATPEYNYSIPGFLKNAIDSVSVPGDLNPFKGKIGALMSSSTGMLGGARAQYHLRQVFTFLDSRILNKPEVFINFVDKKIDEKGRIKDEQSLKFMRELLSNLVSEARRDKLKER